MPSAHCPGFQVLPLEMLTQFALGEPSALCKSTKTGCVSKELIFGASRFKDLEDQTCFDSVRSTFLSAKQVWLLLLTSEKRRLDKDL